MITAELGCRFRQEGVLDHAGDPQFLFDALPLLGLLLLLGHGALELLGTLCNPLFEVPIELPDLFFYPLELGDVVIHSVSAHLVPTHGHRHGQKFHIHQRSIFAATPGDDGNSTVARDLPRVLEDFRVYLWCPGNQVVYTSPDGLGLAITEQPFGCRIPRNNPFIPVHDRDRNRAVEPRVLYDSEDLPQQHQADQDCSPDIDTGSQAAAPIRRAPGIDDEDTYGRHESVRKDRGPYWLFGESRCGAWRIARLAWSRRLLARSQLGGEGTQGYKHISQRPAYIGERTRSIGVVQRPVSEVTVCYY